MATIAVSATTKLLSKEMKMKTKTEMETDQRLADAKGQSSAKQRLPSFISHPNRIVLRVFEIDNNHGFR